MTKNQLIPAIPIVTASNNDYAPYTEVMLRSVLENLKTALPLDIYVIDDELSAQNKLRLLQIAASNEHVQLDFLTVDKAVYDDCLISDHITTTAYLRISVPPLLKKKGYRKVLYLDADALVLADVSELFMTDLAQKTIGAVIDPGQAFALERLGIESADYYFNSGVMVIDLDRWQARDITQKTLDYLNQHDDKIIYHDQDALNAVLYEDWQALHPKWNMQTSLIFDYYEAPTKNYTALYAAGRQTPAIVHFTGHDKPWNTLKNHPYQTEYLKRLANIQTVKVGAN